MTVRGRAARQPKTCARVAPKHPFFNGRREQRTQGRHDVPNSRGALARGQVGCEQLHLARLDPGESARPEDRKDVSLQVAPVLLDVGREDAAARASGVEHPLPGVLVECDARLLPVLTAGEIRGERGLSACAPRPSPQPTGDTDCPLRPGRRPRTGSRAGRSQAPVSSPAEPPRGKCYHLSYHPPKSDAPNNEPDSPESASIKASPNGRGRTRTCDLGIMSPLL